MGLTAFVDTNGVLRHVIGDSPDQPGRASALLQRPDQLVLTPMIFAEAAHVLRSHYGMSRQAVFDRLGAVLRLPALTGDFDLLSAALDIYRRHGVSLPDALLAAEAMQAGIPKIVSFDRGFDRIAGVTLITP